MTIQDIRNAKTRAAYRDAVLVAAFSKAEEAGIDTADIVAVSDFVLLKLFAREAGTSARPQKLYKRVAAWLQGLPLDNEFATYPICEWLIATGQVSAALIPADQTITEKMVAAADRHFDYLAWSLLDNANHSTLCALDPHNRPFDYAAIR